MSFTQEPTSRSSRDLTEVVDIVAHRLVPDFDTFPPQHKVTIKEGILPVVTATLNWVDEQPHRARRGDDVEAWIKAARDRHDDVDSQTKWAHFALDDLLDDYRDHADYGLPLDQEVVEGPTDVASP